VAPASHVELTVRCNTVTTRSWQQALANEFRLAQDSLVGGDPADGLGRFINEDK
jgi:hypothetical protein